MKYNEIIEKLFIAYCIENNKIDVYCDYRDFEDPEYCLYINKNISGYRAYKEKLSKDEIISNIYECYLDYESDAREYFIQDFITTLKPIYRAYIENHDNFYSDLLDIFYSYVIFDYSDVFNRFFNSEIKINLIYNKNSSGYDFLSFIKPLIHKNGYFLKNHEWIKKLINNISLNDKDLKQLESDKKDRFLNSLYNEIINSWLDSPLDYVIIASITIENYFKLIDNKKPCKVVIKKDAMSGFYDKYNGGGSILEIDLNNDITFNNNELDVFIEGIDKYSVNDVYGLTGSCFKDCIELQ